MVIIPAYHIASLDEAVQSKRISGEANVISLRQAVMALKLNEFPDLNLFQSVDQNAFEGRIFFVCHSKLESEAQAVVPILALIMETKFGPRAWRWFFHSAKDAIIGYSWTEETGVTSEEDLILEDTWSKGTIGLFDEDISEDDASSTPKGKGRKKRKRWGGWSRLGLIWFQEDRQIRETRKTIWPRGNLSRRLSQVGLKRREEMKGRAPQRALSPGIIRWIWTLLRMGSRRILGSGKCCMP